MLLTSHLVWFNINSMKIHTLLLIDTSSYLFRAYHALPYLSNSKGLPTNAILGFTNMLLKIIRDYKPDYIATVLDSKEPTFRDKIFEEYKALRPPTPDDLKIQIPYVLEIIKAMGIEIVEKSGYEADDLIATIVERLKNSGIKIMIVTGDKDMYQLVSENVLILDTMKELVIDRDGVIKKFGIPPELIPEFLALTGDAIDNIPGVKGVGAKTAGKLLKEFGSIENIFKNLDRLSQKNLKDAFLESEEQLKVNKILVKLDTGIDIEFKLENFKQKQMDSEKLKKLFVELEFFRLLKEFGLEKAKLIKYNFLTRNDLIESFLIEITGKECGIATSENMIAIADSDSSATAFSYTDAVLIDILNRAEKVYLYNLKDILKKLNPRSIPYEKIFDIKLISYLLNPNYPPQNLQTIVLREAGSLIENTANSQPSLFSSPESDEKTIREACAIYESGRILNHKLVKEELKDLYIKIELPLVSVINDMESRGIKVNTFALKNFLHKLETQLSSIRKEIFEIAGEEFNLDSPKQLQKILFEKLNLPHKKRTKTGFSTDSDVLEQLSDIHPLPAKILEYRSLAKTKNTYVVPLMESINPATGRIHPTFHQDIVATGRLSCSDPNLQNIPAIGALADELRNAFVAEENMLLLSADYSQIELRLLAHFSQDPTLIRSFREEKDIHSATAAVLFNVNENDVTPEMRRKAKAINFGIIYGMSPIGLSQELKIPYEEADNYIQEYFLKYPGVKKFIEETIELTRQKKYVRTLLGRLRPVPDILSSNESIRSSAERVAVNSIMQGSAADIIKLSMIGIYRRLKKEGLNAWLILQIHDELILEVEKDIITEVKHLVKEEMEGCVNLSVSLKVEMKEGKTWGEIKI